MAIRTAAKRAYLQGEGVKRQEWGIYTVVVNKRGGSGGHGGACPHCIPWLGKILIDDVWSDGPKSGKSPQTGKKYPLMSAAIAAGLYHPRCKDSHTTYFEGLSTPPKPATKQDVKEAVEAEKQEQRENYAQRQAEKYERLAKGSLDPENQKQYKTRADRWEREVEKYHIKANAQDDPVMRLFYDRRAEQMKDMSDNRLLQKLFGRVRYKDGAPVSRITDVTETFLREAAPNSGSVIFDNLTSISDQETAKWLHKMFGGDIHCLAENSDIGKMPDALWRGQYWEFKAPTSKNAIDDRIRQGNKQLLEALIRDGKPHAERGLVIDISGMKIEREETIQEIKRRTINRYKGPTTVIVRNGEDFVTAFHLT